MIFTVLYLKKSYQQKVQHRNRFIQLRTFIIFLNIITKQMSSPQKTNMSLDQIGGFPMFRPPDLQKSEKDDFQQLSVNFCFFKQYKHLLNKQKEICQQIKKLQIERDHTLKKLRALQIEAEEKFDDRFRRSRREKGKRRSGFQVKKEHKCQVEGCTKMYVSMGSMLQHMRIKHPDSYESRKKQKIIIEFLSFRQMGLEL